MADREKFREAMAQAIDARVLEIEAKKDATEHGRTWFFDSGLVRHLNEAFDALQLESAQPNDDLISKSELIGWLEQTHQHYKDLNLRAMGSYTTGDCQAANFAGAVDAFEEVIGHIQNSTG